MEALSANDPRAVGEFQLRARLGAGGMGRVYLGFSPAGRAVAIKVVHPELARDAEFRQRFAREVAAARAVSGMYTAPVVAAGLDDDPPWLATAFVPGPSLADVIARHGPLPEPAVWRLAAGLAEALRAVHACSLVHRDLKPANVLLAADGPHVIDFGISRAFEGTSVTAAGMMVGTPGYMSPEQAEGAQAGPASDVFSLGCVLAYAATGNAPFGGGSAASVLYRVVTGQPDLTGLSGPLRDVISGCLSKDPSQRPGLPAVGAMITQAGPAMTATPTSFWPDSVAGVIQATAAYPTPTQVSAAAAGQAPPGLGQPAMAQPGAMQPGAMQPGMAQNGYHAMATASMAAPRPAGPPASGAHVPAAQGAPGLPTDPAAARSQPVTWPQTAPARPASRPLAAQAPPATRWPRPLPADAMSRYAPAPLRPQPPTPVLAAAWLMYSGAAFSLLWTLVSLATIGEVKTAFTARHPLLSGKAANSLAAVASVEVLIGGGAVVALWLWLAFASKQGRSWARTAGTVLFGVDTLALLLTLGSPGIGGTKGIGVVIWLIGLVTVILLWRRQSGEYFALRR
jgi:hypothetical protein